MTRTNPGVRVLGVAASLLLALGVSDAAAQEDPNWLPWLGCWEPAGGESVVSEETGTYVVCVSPAEGGVRFQTIADGETVAERTVIADGERRTVDQDGCTGWEAATWSADGQRAYLISELTCDGVTRATTGVLTMATPNTWLDLQGVAAGENEAVRVRRYRAASEARIRAAGATVPEEGRALALSTARTAAAAPLSLEDVQEAAGVLSEDVVNSLLIEREADIRIDADALRSLAAANVPGGVIDMLVALDNPDKFTIDRGTMVAMERPEERQARGDRSYSRPYAILDYDPFWYGYGYRYGGLFYSPWNRYGWGWGGWYSPPVIIVPPDGDDDRVEPNGRYVKGRGYVPRNTRSGDDDRFRGSRTGSDSRGSVSSGSSTRSSPPSSSGSSTGRTAKRKGGGTL